MNKKIIKLGIVNKVSNVSKVPKSLKTYNQELLNELGVAKETIKSLESQRFYLLKCFAKICEMCKQNEIIKQTFNDFKSLMQTKTKTTKYVVIGVKSDSNVSYKPIEVLKPSDNTVLRKKLRPGRPWSNPYCRAFNANKTALRTRPVPERPPPAPEVTNDCIDIIDNNEIKEEVKSNTEINDNISPIVEGASEEQKHFKDVNDYFSKIVEQFDCHSCDFKDTNYHKLEAHINTIHLKITPYECNICDKTFVSRPSLESHLSCVHPKEEYFFCGLRSCPFSSKNLEEMEGHEKTHPEERVDINRKNFMCKVCPFESQQILTMRKHVNCEHRCWMCGLEMDGKVAVGKHLYERHSNTKEATSAETTYHRKRKNRCEYCLFFAKNLHELTKHMNSSHGFKCEKCEEIFDDKQKLMDHKTTVHVGEPLNTNFRCKTCGNSYLSNRWLEVHIRSHTGERPYKCLMGCQRTFASTKQRGDHHKRFHMNVPLTPCEWPGCDRKYVEKFKMREHCKKDHLKIRNVCCAWPGCDQKFFSEYLMRSHMKSHDSEKRFSCDKCDKKYVSANNLKVHQKSHQNEKPVFKCPVFGCKSKVTFSHRNRHLMAHRKPEELTQIEEYKRRLESENSGQK